MVELKQDTENKILEAAKTVFIQKGMDGARMQEIADEAGINKALLHYYFRSKEKLFEAVFKDALGDFFPKISEVMLSDLHLFEKIKHFVKEYSNLLYSKPYIPGFIIMEVNRNPQAILNYFSSYAEKIATTNLPAIAKQIIDMSKNGEIRPVDPRHLIMSMLSMIVFPIISKPIVKVILFQNNDEDYNQFLLQRADYVSDMIINSIKIK